MPEETYKDVKLAGFLDGLLGHKIPEEGIPILVKMLDELPEERLSERDKVNFRSSTSGVHFKTMLSKETGLSQKSLSQIKWVLLSDPERTLGDLIDEWKATQLNNFVGSGREKLALRHFLILTHKLALTHPKALKDFLGEHAPDLHQEKS